MSFLFSSSGLYIIAIPNNNIVMLIHTKTKGEENTSFIMPKFLTICITLPTTFSFVIGLSSVLLLSPFVIMFSSFL